MNKEYIKRINNSGAQIYCAITGGGQTFIGEYMRVSGASKSIVGVNVPYRQSAFDDFIQFKGLESYSSSIAARRLAVAAYNKSVKYGSDSKHALGLGVTCSLAHDGERQGRQHKINIAIHTYNKTAYVEYFLVQGRTREQEELLAANLILRFLANYLIDIKESLSCGLFWNDTFSYYNTTNKDYVSLINGETDIFLSNVEEVIKDSNTLIIYPGSFNPYHYGHSSICSLAQEILGQRPILEISIHNVDKPRLDYIEIEEKVSSLFSHPYFLTKASTIVEKTLLFKKHYPDKSIVFVVGADTWERLWDAKYGYSPETIVELMNRNSVKFLVFPRTGSSISGEHNELMIEDKRLNSFNQDISSSQLRKAKLAL